MIFVSQINIQKIMNYDFGDYLFNNFIIALINLNFNIEKY